MRTFTATMTGVIAAGLAVVAAVPSGAVPTAVQPTTVQHISAGAAATTLAAQAAAVSAGAAGSVGAKPIAFGRCADPDLVKAGAVCGFLTVPLDWAKPTGTTIKIAVSKVAHSVPAAQYQGVMITNPGGPGGSGLSLSTLGSAVPQHAGDAYDWIGFDPRGVGASVPSLTCNPTYFAGARLDYRPTTKAIETFWLLKSKNYAASCGRAGGALLSHLKTVDVARDVDYLRAALGRSQINYYGFSYGTYLGQVYASLFPTRVRRMVLDSTVDPRGVWYQANLQQDVAFEKTVDVFFGWVARHDSDYHLGSNALQIKKRWYAQKALLAKHPADGVVGADEWTDIFLFAGYYQSVWTDLGNVLSSWILRGDVPTLKAAYDGYIAPTNDNGYAIYDAVQCTDVQWPTSWAQWQRDNAATDRVAPFETWGNAWYNAPCLYWPAKAGTPVTIDGQRIKSVLMIDETLDAATPYSGSLYVRSLFPGARLIAEPGGTTHAGTLYGNSCVDNRIALYLRTGQVPSRKAGGGADFTCAPLPQPVPKAAGSTTASLGASLSRGAKLKLASSIAGLRLAPVK